MGNAIFEQYGYKTARDLMTDLARDIADGGDLIAVKKAGATCKTSAYKFDGGYWLITFRCGRASSIDYLESVAAVLFIMGD